MYHRIAVDGPSALALYRVVPAAFERQPAYLRRHGYRAIALDEYGLPGKRRRLGSRTGSGPDLRRCLPRLPDRRFATSSCRLHGHPVRRHRPCRRAGGVGPRSASRPQSWAGTSCAGSRRRASPSAPTAVRIRIDSEGRRWSRSAVARRIRARARAWPPGQRHGLPLRRPGPGGPPRHGRVRIRGRGHDRARPQPSATT